MIQLSDQERKKAREYTLVMLGAPVLKIELDEAQLDLCIEMTVDFIGQYEDEIKDKERKVFLQQVNEGTCCFAKEILGRIRSKFAEIPGGIKLDGKDLLKEGRQDLKEWKASIKEQYK